GIRDFHVTGVQTCALPIYIAAAEAIGQPLVIEPQLVQDRGVDVVDGQGILDDGVAKLVGASKREASPEAAARQEQAVAVDVVVEIGRASCRERGEVGVGGG